ncbi:MAG: hypothetical protein ACOCP8_08115, partial [archaeon]
MLIPSIGLFKDMILPKMSPLATDLIKSMEAYDKAGLHDKKEEYDKFKSKLSKKAKLGKIKKTEYLKSISINENKFIKNEDIKKWLKSIGISKEFSNKKEYKDFVEVNLLDKVLLGYTPNEAPIKDDSESQKNFLDELGKNMEQLLNDMEPAIPSLLSQFFKIIKIIISKAFPQFFMDVVMELFKWVLDYIFEAIPFLGNKSNDSSDSKAEKEIKEKFKDTSQEEKLKDLQMGGIREWLESIGLDENLAKLKNL